MPDDHSASHENAVQNIVAQPNYPQAIIRLAQSFVATHDTSPRSAALFATQQRWLLSHAALAEHYRSVADGAGGLTRKSLVRIALEHGISSRNTAKAFFDEVIRYGTLEPAQNGQDDCFIPTPISIFMLKFWYETHFAALDLIDGGTRVSQFQACGEAMLPIMQPFVTHQLLTNLDVRVPGPLYTLFTWADAGGLFMDRLMAGIDPQSPAGQERYISDVETISSLAQAFGLSRPHTSRKMAEAESIGGLGWTGKRGQSRIWISRGFHEEYSRAQAHKLVILDAAFSKTGMP